MHESLPIRLLDNFHTRQLIHCHCRFDSHLYWSVRRLGLLRKRLLVSCRQFWSILHNELVLILDSYRQCVYSESSKRHCWTVAFTNEWYHQPYICVEAKLNHFLERLLFLHMLDKWTFLLRYWRNWQHSDAWFKQFVHAGLHCCLMGLASVRHQNSKWVLSIWYSNNL